MKLESIQIKDFKRFADLSITGLPSTAKLVLLTGPNGSGKTSLFEAFNYWTNYQPQTWYDIFEMSSIMRDPPLKAQKTGVKFYRKSI